MTGAAQKRCNKMGCYKILVSLVGANGISYGQAGEGLAAGSNSSPYVVENPLEVPIALPDRTTLDFTGSDRWLTSYQYGITSMGNFAVTTAEFDAGLIALITGTSVDQVTNQAWTEFTENVLASSLPQISLMVIYRIQSTEPTTFGTTKYVHTIIPRAWLAPKSLTGAPAFQGKGQYTFQLTPASSDRHINGNPFDTNLDAQDNTVALYHIIADNALFYVTGVANGATFTLDASRQPVSSAVGTSSNTKNQIVKYVTSTAVATIGVADTITPANGTFAVGTAVTVAANDVVTALFESNYLAAA